MKKCILRAAAAFLAAALLYPGQAQAVSAQKAILMDGQTGRVLYAKAADSRSLIASTTKIMTALLVCEQCNVLEQVQIPKEAVGIEGSSMYLQCGEVLTVQELLYGLMLSSGNDAAVALAIHCAGSVTGFAELMNEKAGQLGLKDTHFTNPHGLDAKEHYSTAQDLAILAAYAMKNPIFAQTVGTKQVRVGNRFLTNHNKLLWQVDGAEGIKTGFTKAAGRILVSSAQRQGRRLICVTINDGNDWVDHKKLYEDGFAGFEPKLILSAGECVGSMQVLGGQSETVSLRTAEDVNYPLAPGEEVSFILPGKDHVFAPVVENARAGFAYLCVDGKPVAKVDVYFDETVEQSAPEKLPFWSRWFGGKA